MRLPAELSRRRLISIAGPTMASWLGGKSAVSTRADATPSSGRNPLARLGAEFPCSAALGNACRAALPQGEASQVSLMRTIRPLLQTAPAIDPLRRVREQSREDFRLNRVVAVDGWVLSLTEARVYALASLITAQGAAATKADPLIGLRALAGPSSQSWTPQ